MIVIEEMRNAMAMLEGIDRAGRAGQCQPGRHHPGLGGASGQQGLGVGAEAGLDAGRTGSGQAECMRGLLRVQRSSQAAAAQAPMGPSMPLLHQPRR
jgi:hypothetical protein